jgi:hypothetical protein
LLTEKIPLPTAQVSTTDPESLIVEENEVWFEAQAHLACKSCAIGGNSVVLLTLKKGFPILSFRRNRV